MQARRGSTIYSYVVVGIDLSRSFFGGMRSEQPKNLSRLDDDDDDFSSSPSNAAASRGRYRHSPFKDDDDDNDEDTAALLRHYLVYPWSLGLLQGQFHFRAGLRANPQGMHGSHHFCRYVAVVIVLFVEVVVIERRKYPLKGSENVRIDDHDDDNIDCAKKRKWHVRR